MTVKKLIAELKKMPQNLTVYWADHDHSEFETNNIANRVYHIDPNEMDEYERNMRTPGNPDEEYVVIRP